MADTANAQQQDDASVEAQRCQDTQSTTVKPLRARVAEWVEEYLQAGHVEVRSDAVLQREQFTLWHPWTGKFHRWYMILPVIITQMCIGSLYSWSIFNKPMDTQVWIKQGYATGANAQAFTICVASFGFGTLIFGSWVEKHGPFAACLRTLVLTPMGWAFAALGSYVGSLPVVYALFGVMHGVGAALAYISTCSALQKFFPEFKGLATGMAVMGFGLGSFCWTLLGRSLLGSYAPYQVQGIFAAIFFVALAVALPFLRMPPPGYKPNTEYIATEQSCRGRAARWFAQKSSRVPVVESSFKVLEAVQQLEFVLLLGIVFGQFITGVVFLSSAADMTQYLFGYDAAYASFITSMLNLVNFTGRVGWGFASDRMGRKTFYLMSTAAQAICLGIMSVAIQVGNFGLWCACFLIIGSLYGGGFGVLPAFVSDVFGPKISGATHGIMITVWALSSIVGIPVFTSFTGRMQTTVAGVRVPSPDAYVMNCYWLAALPATAFALLLLLNVNPRDRNMRRLTHTLRVRIFSFVVSLRCLGPHQQQEEESMWLRLGSKIETQESGIDPENASSSASDTASTGDTESVDMASPAALLKGVVVDSPAPEPTKQQC